MGNLTNTKQDSLLIEKFMETGSYSPSTIFKRSERLDKYGWRTYWNVTCPVCEESYEAMLSNLSNGCRGCSCSLVKHDKAYLHEISLEGNLIGVKYGITSRSSKTRLYNQGKKSPCDLRCLGVWEFNTVSDCRKAERECKKKFKSFVEKELLPDGHTETAPISAINDIISIYEKNGGIRISYD